jgi:hypothetical protein
MCRCTPNIRTPFCGKPSCGWPDSIEIEELKVTHEENIYHNLEKIQKRVTALEMWKQLQESHKEKISKTPYKCPVCYGKGKIIEVTYDAKDLCELVCPACKGECVLWG